MVELFLSTDNIPFSVALVMLIGIALLEGVGTVVGVGLSQFLESILPDMDVPEADLTVETDVEVETPSTFTRLLGWIKIKDVPMLVVLVVFLTFFSLSGFTLQAIAKSLVAFYLPWFISIIPATLIALFFVRHISLMLSKLLVKDETEVVSTESFIGHIAVISLGTAQPGTPAEAKLTDGYGQVHYIRVEPDDENDRFEQLTEVLLVEKHGHVFKAIRNPNAMLTD